MGSLLYHRKRIHPVTEKMLLMGVYGKVDSLWFIIAGSLRSLWESTANLINVVFGIPIRARNKMLLMGDLSLMNQPRYST